MRWLGVRSDLGNDHSPMASRTEKKPVMSVCASIVPDLVHTAISLLSNSTKGFAPIALRPAAEQQQQSAEGGKGDGIWLRNRENNGWHGNEIDLGSGRDGHNVEKRWTLSCK